MRKDNCFFKRNVTLCAKKIKFSLIAVFTDAFGLMLMHLANEFSFGLQVFSLCLLCAGTSNSFMYLKHQPVFFSALSTSGFRETSWIPRTCHILLIILIYNLFELQYRCSVGGIIKTLPDFYVKSKSVNLSLSVRIIFAFDLHVLKVNTREHSRAISLILCFQNDSLTANQRHQIPFLCDCTFFAIAAFYFNLLFLSCFRAWLTRQSLFSRQIFFVDAGDQYDLSFLVIYIYIYIYLKRTFLIDHSKLWFL